jgi:Trypsin-like peptidase domain
MALCAGVAAEAQQGSKPHATKGSSATTIRDELTSVVSITVFDSKGTPLGQGSGFLLDSKGTLVTNYHVIEYASGAIAKSANGAFYKVRGVLALDSSNDLAILQLDGNGFTHLRLGDSDKTEVGDKVIAIGSPLGLEASVSDGVISALRTFDAAPVIQTTAAISPGSGGGALLNTKGEVIGVTTFNVRGGQNLNFAVPAKYIKPLLLSQTVLPFAPKQLPPETATEAAPKEVEKAAIPRDLPTNWIAVDSGTPVTVRFEGDYLYEHTKFEGDGRYIKKVEDNCETKRQGNQWVGKCHMKIWLTWGSALGDNICSLETDEIITSVTPRRIEGEGQTLDAPSHPSECPIPGVGKQKFAYIPKY